ncbi:uncharacterized protein HD556DRAFT_1204116, partial [Suillus plorans]
LGDPIAERAEQLLALYAPYPGDDLENETSFSGQRFVIYRTSDTHYVVMDGARRLEEDLVVPITLIQNEKFCLSDWYCTHLAKHFGMNKSMAWLMHARIPMGDPALGRICDILN